MLFPLLLTIVIVFVTYGLLSFRSISTEWNHSVEQWGLKFAELAKRATNHGMLLNRKDDVQYVVQLVGSSPGVEALHVYDKHGTIAFSDHASEVGERVDMKAEACVICHDKTDSFRPVQTANRTRIYRNPAGKRILGIIEPIENEPRCAASGCHAPVSEQSILGVLDVQMSLDPLDVALRDARRRSFWLTIAVALMVSAATIAFVYRIVRRPVLRLHEGTLRIAAGDLDSKIDVRSTDELGQLAGAFNHMTDDLRKARAEAATWSQRLEQKVMEKTDELSRIQRQVLLMEKMASLGKLAATVAHELNNPLGGILNYAKLVERELREGTLDGASRLEMERYLTAIQQESRRSGDIVKNLLLFARQSRRRLAQVRLSIVIDRGLLLMRHRMDLGQILLAQCLEPGDDGVVCDADQIQQALVALVVNAIEAMEETNGGTLGIRLIPQNEAVDLEVSDTGVGIPDEALPHIFEPFFSTKDKESGVGLGLAVVYGIVRGHGGTIDVKTTPGQGTTFTIRLPRQPQINQDEVKDSE